MKQVKELINATHKAVDQSVSMISEIHHTVANVAVDALANVGVPAKFTADLRKIQNSALDNMYGNIRTLNQQVADLGNQWLEAVA